MLLNEECVNYSAYCIEGVLVGLQIRQHVEPIIYKSWMHLCTTSWHFQLLYLATFDLFFISGSKWR